MVVHGSGPPFTFRMGERPERELRVNVREFKLRNQTKTSNERQAAADQVPPEMVNDPGPIRELAREARRSDHCRGTVDAASKTFARVSARAGS